MHLPYVLLDTLDVSPGSLVALDDIVCTVFLIGSNEVGVVDTGQGLHLGHLLTNQLLEGWLKNLRPIHGIGKVHTADVPTANDKIIGVDHREHIMERNVDLLTGLGIST